MVKFWTGPNLGSKCAHLLVLVACFTSVVAVLQGPSRIILEPDGGYSGIVVKISDDINEESCADILQNFQTLMTEASQALNEALDGRVFFKDVTVVVPNSWRDAKCKTQIHLPRGTSTYGTPDMTIDTEHPFHRESPYTQQSRGCGQPGEFLSIPASFLTSWSDTVKTWGNPAKMFVHEWAKLRYGIFDEFGFAGDDIYPNYFKIRDEIVPTGSSNVPIEGNWVKKDRPEEECDPELQDEDPEYQCFFQPLVSQGNQGATCSLGYMPFLTNVKNFCSSDEIWHRKDALAPTKHNILCQGRSAEEVILDHEDFSGRVLSFVRRSDETQDAEQSTESPNEPESSTPELPGSNSLGVTLKVVRHPAAKYVLIIESSSSMIEQNLWKWVHKAAQKFIRYDLVDNSRLAIVTFSNESSIQHNLASITDERSRARLADTIPDKYKVQRSPNQRCVICGVQTAMQKVLNGDEAGAHLILITRGDNNTLSLTDENIILEHARYYQIKFSAILLPQGEQSALSFYDSVSQLTGGRTVVFATPSVGEGSASVGTDLYSKMMDAFHDIRRLDSPFPADVPIPIHTQTTSRPAGNLGTSGSFVIDTTLGRETQFSVVVEDADDYYIKSITFTDSKGQTYGPYSSLTNDFNVINVKTINFPQDTLTPPFDDPAHLGMTWQYVVQWYTGGNMELQNVIRVESKPRNLGSFGLIDVTMWTNSDATSDIVTSLHPLAMFVSLTRGKSPILEARVRVAVTVSLSNGTVIPVDNVELYDKGNGDPDLTAGDGIYSRYLTSYPAIGRYSFSVEVDDNEEAAYTVQEGRAGRAMKAKPPSPGPLLCCGSRIDVPKDLRFLTGHFRRQVDSCPVVHLIDVPDPNEKDRMAPSRIADLRLTVDADEQKLMAEWTAPGDDFDHGTVAGYNFIVSEDVSDLLDPLRQPPILHTVTRPDDAGTEASYSFTFKRYDKDYHVGMFAFDEAGNRANISNIVLVRIPEPETTVDPNSSTGAPVGPQDTDWVMIGAVVGAALIIFIIVLVVLYIYCFVVKRRRNSRHPNAKSSGVNVDLHHNGGLVSGAGSDNATDNGSYDDTKNSSSNHLVPKISTISNAYRSAVSTNGGSFANGITPTYWSASQLLKEHEERKLRETLSQRPSVNRAMSGEELSMGNNNNESLGDETNVAYDYSNEPFHQYGYYHGSPMIDTYPAQLDPYFGYSTHRLSTADSTGYPVTYGYQMHPNGGDMYSPHVATMMDQFNATLEGSSDAESTLMRNGGPTHQTGSSRLKPGSGTLVPKHSGSDQSSSGTLGVANQSLQGSLLSVNSGRPPSSTSKTRNITQV